MAIRLEHSTTAKCKPEHVWKKFSVLEEWPWWNRVVNQTRWLRGEPWTEGSQFNMEVVYPKKMSFKPVILPSTPPAKIGWVGKAMGLTGEHWFSFEAQADGNTLIKTWEVLSGWKTWLIGAGLKSALEAMHRDWLEALKAEAETIARREYARS